MATSNTVYFREGITVEDKDGTSWKAIAEDALSTTAKPGHVTICASGAHAVWATSETNAK